MDKKQLHHTFTRIRALRPWYFLVLAVLSAAICGFALRSNYQHMTVLRDAVYQADKDNGDVAGALQNLQRYVVSHMNTNLASGPNPVYPPIQLVHTYDRAVQQRSQQTADANARLYNEAQKYCEAQNSVDFSGRNRVPCIQEYVKNHPITSVSIPDSLYKFDFISPRWSPDLAGWSMLVSIAGFLLFIIIWGLQRWLKVKTR